MSRESRLPELRPLSLSRSDLAIAGTMAQVVVRMKTIDLRKAELQAVAGEDVKTLQALLNVFLTAGDIGEDGSPIPPLTLDGTAGEKTKQAVQHNPKQPLDRKSPIQVTSKKRQERESGACLFEVH